MTRLAVWRKCGHLGGKQLPDSFSVCSIRRGGCHLNGLLALKKKHRETIEGFEHTYHPPTCGTLTEANTHRRSLGSGSDSSSGVTSGKPLHFSEFPLLQNGFCFSGVTTPLSDPTRLAVCRNPILYRLCSRAPERRTTLHVPS